MNATLIKNVRFIDCENDFDGFTDLYVAADLLPEQRNVKIINAAELIAIPGLIDLHVHFRQPGFEHKETIASGSDAALSGGVTTVVVMPNTLPALDSPEKVQEQIQASLNANSVKILVAAAVTQGLRGEICNDYKALKAAGAVALTDDGRPVMSDDIMNISMRACAENDLVFMQHAEDLRLSKNYSMNEGDTSRLLGIPGQPAEAEGIMVERDIALAAKYKARYHVLHISTERSLNAVRKAKMAGLRVTCEVTPHHLLLNDAECINLDSNKKMNPPLRRKSDQEALIVGLVDGTIDAVASDHAPHAKSEKQLHFCEAPFGVVGLETAFAVLTTLVNNGVISLKRAVALMTSGPAAVLNRNVNLKKIASGYQVADLVLIDLRKLWEVSPDDLVGKSKNSAFLGLSLTGKVHSTYLRGQLRYEDRHGLTNE